MATALAHLLVAYIALVAPWLGRFRYRQLQNQLAAHIAGARERFYKLAVLQQLARIALVLLIWLLWRIPGAALGFTNPFSWQTTASLLTIFLLAGILSTVWFRYRGDKQLKRLQKNIGAIIPTTAPERFWFALTGLNAGISEELVFRGFFLCYLGTYAPNLGTTWMLVISSAIFGFCHLYQGVRGVLLTALVGFGFGVLYLTSGSLLFPIVVHSLIDVRLVFILTPQRSQSLQEKTQVAAARA